MTLTQSEKIDRDISGGIEDLYQGQAEGGDPHRVTTFSKPLFFSDESSCQIIFKV